MSDRVDELASNVDDALVSVDELEDDPGKIKEKKITKVKHALQHAKQTVDDMEDADDWVCTDQQRALGTRLLDSDVCPYGLQVRADSNRSSRFGSRRDAEAPSHA
jgi:hypothetical protein